MDRAELSAAIIDELGQLFVNTLKENAAALLESDLDGIERRLQDVSRTVFGRVVEHTIAAIAASQSKEQPHCSACHQLMRLVDDERSRSLQGLVGDYNIVRPYFVCDHCHQGIAPLDVRVGIGAGVLSPGLDRVACRLGIDDSFGDAADACRLRRPAHRVGQRSHQAGR